MLQIENFLQKPAHTDVEVFTIGANAKLRAHPEILGKNGAGYAGHGKCRAKILGVDLAGGDGLRKPSLIRSGKQDRAGDSDGISIIIGHEEEAEVARRLREMQIMAQRAFFDGGISIYDFGCARQREVDSIAI